jgi:hypothetical protein
MGDSADQDRARQWRMKAEELRAVADQMHNPTAQESFRRMAATYDRLAERLEGGYVSTKDTDIA